MPGTVSDPQEARQCYDWDYQQKLTAVPSNRMRLPHSLLCSQDSHRTGPSKWTRRHRSVRVYQPGLAVLTWSQRHLTSEKPHLHSIPADVRRRGPGESSSRSSPMSSSNCKWTGCGSDWACVVSHLGFMFLRITSIPRAGVQSRGSFVCLYRARLGDSSSTIPRGK